MKKPSTRPLASALQIRSDWITAKFAAEGNACFCASGMVRYWTAYAAGLTMMTRAVGIVQGLHLVIIYLCQTVRQSPGIAAVWVIGGKPAPFDIRKRTRRRPDRSPT